MNLSNWQTQLRKGLLDVVVLNLLQEGPRHGYEMVQALNRQKGLQMREGNLYPILARLEMDGLVSAFTENSSGGPPRRSFELTSQGRKTLREMNEHWDLIVKSIEQVRKGRVR